MKQLKLWGVLFLLFAAPAVHAQQEGEQAFYYKETSAGFEPIFELPHDTVVKYDTVYVSDIDELFWRYHQRRTNLNEVLKHYTVLKGFVDSVDALNGESLFYNYFLRNNNRKLSNSFIIKEFRVKQGSMPEITSFDTGAIENRKSVRREILFRCEGADLTDWFLNNRSAILKALSCMFTEMQNDPDGVTGINLYFPDFSFKEKKAMAQFIKTVRIVMDSSRDFKYGKTTLNIIFNSPEGKRKEMSDEFEYCLLLKASDVFYINAGNVVDDFYVKGNGTLDEMDDAGFFTQLRSHFYIARYNISGRDIINGQLVKFAPDRIAFALDADYPENDWEPSMYALFGSLLLVIVLTLLYIFYQPFSIFLYKNLVTVMIVAVVLVIEILVLAVLTFEKMCAEDSISIVEKNPVLIFSLPLVMVIIIPLLRGLSKKRALP